MLFVACCFEKAKSIYHIADVLYHYRMNEESVCHRYYANMDQQRCILAEKLKIIAIRMDNELGEMCSNSSYHTILSAYERFMFGIVSDVFLLQYYHNDNPHKKHRRREALKFLHAEPFSTAIKNVSYKSLSMSGKLKKFMLRFNMVSLFCLMKKLEKA